MRYFGSLKNQILLAHVFGIPVRVDYRWVFVLGLMTLITAVVLSPRYIESFPTALVLGFCLTVVLFFSVFFHELAHAFAARMEGVDVLEIVLHPFGGLARLRREPDTPRADFRIAIAGPAASFLLAVFFLLLMAAANAAGLGVLVILFFLLGMLNFTLAVFNLFPGYPLDGGRILRAYLWRRGKDINEATILTGRSGQIIAAGLLLFGIVVAVTQGEPVNGFWAILVGLFLYDAATSIIRDTRRLEETKVEDAMQLPVAVAPEESVQHFIDAILPLHRQHVFLVAKNKQLYGLLLLEDLKKLPREAWRETSVQTVMRPVTPDFFVETTAPLAEAKTLLRENGVGVVGVIDEKGELVGFLQRGRIRKRS